MKRVAAALTLLVPIVLFLSPPDVICASLEKQFQQAESAVEGQDYIAALGQLESIMQMEIKTDDVAKANFLMGRALYEQAFSVIYASRENGKVKFKDIAKPQVADLKKATEHFLTVIRIAPEGELTTEAYFMLGKVWDYDCLQKFKKSQDSYQYVVDISPESELGVEAKQCVDRIEGYFNGHGGTH